MCSTGCYHGSCVYMGQFEQKRVYIRAECVCTRASMCMEGGIASTISSSCPLIVPNVASDSICKSN